MTRPALFIDKDGTLIENIPYNVDPARIRLTPGAAVALRELSDHGFAVVVVSNQAGVALGRFEERALAVVERTLRERLLHAGVPVTGVYWCPHHPAGSVARFSMQCDCRKPLPGMLRRAAREHDLDLDASWMVGDILDDIEAGRRAGCRTILLDNGHETEWQVSRLRLPHFVVSDIARIADVVLTAAALPGQPGEATVVR